MGRNSSQVQATEYNVFYGPGAGTDIGYTLQDATMATLGFKYVVIQNAAQTQGIIAASKTGVAPTIRITMMQTQFASLSSLAGSQLYPIVDGAKLAYGMGSRKLDLPSNAMPIRLHPAGVDDTDFSQDIYYWLASPDLSAVQYKGTRDSQQLLEVPFMLFQDTTKSLDFDYGLLGDWTATTNAAPNYVYIDTEYQARVPYKHTSALTLASKQKKQVYGHAFYKTNTTTTCTVNEAGNVAATDQTFDIDALSVASSMSVGQYWIVDTEVLQIESISYSATDEATVTWIRGIGGSVAASHNDDATMTLLTNVYVIPVTLRGTWASSAGDDVTVGDSVASGTKGLLTWIADGSDTITCTVTAIASPNLTVTATT